MSALILPSRFRQQPQYPAKVKPEYSGGSIFIAPIYDAANGTPVAIPSTLSVATTALGKVITNASQTSNAVVFKNSLRTSNWSAVFVGSFVTGSSSYDTFAHFKDDGYALKFGNSYGGTNTFGIVVPFGGSYFSSISNRSGVPCVVAFLGTNGANYDVIVRWLDTNQVVVQTGVTLGTPVLTAGTSYLLSEENSPYTCGANSTLALAGTIPRRMPVAEALSVVQNPWRIFKAPPRFYFAPSGGAPTAYTLTADSGAFALTGTAATLTAGRVLAADSGAFALAGADATLLTGRVLAADSGVFALTGTDAVLAAGHVLSAESSVFELTGADVTLVYTPVSGDTYTLTAGSGTFALTGSAATLAAGRVLVADSGAFALTGTAAVLAAGHVLSADSASIVLTGADVTLVYTPVGGGAYTLIADSGSFALTGTAATLTAGLGLPGGAGPTIIIPRGTRPPNVGGIRI